MKNIFLILICLLFSSNDSVKIDLKKLDFSGFNKNLNLNVIPTNNPDNILSKTYLQSYEIDALKLKAKNYIPKPVTDNDIVIFETTRGTIKLKLFNNVAPNHCYNFKKLANSGFYDETYFHRIMKGFMIQGGDINTRDSDISNDGYGGPGWSVDAEFNSIKHKKGILSMARGSDVNSAGSQFFICSADAFHLDGQYTAFGEVIENERVIDLLENTETERTKILRSCFDKIPDTEDPSNWIKVIDGRERQIKYSKIPEEHSKKTYNSYVMRQFNNDTPIASPKIIKIRVLNSDDK